MTATAQASTTVQIPVQKLLNCAQRVVGVIENQQTMQILTHVLINISNQRITLTATDSEIELQASESLEGVDTELSFTVMGRKLLDICKSVPAEAAADIEIFADHINFQVNDSQFKLVSLDVATFPSFGAVEAQMRSEISEVKLLSILKKTSFAMAQTDVRYYLNGLLFEINGNSIIAVATDGHRLAVNSAIVATKFAHSMQSIIPRKAVLEIVRMLEPNDAPVTVIINVQDIRIIKDGVRFSSKLIDGRFPDYKRAMPHFEQAPIKFERQALKNALSRIVIMSNDKVRGVNMEINASKVRVSANTPDLGAAEEFLSIEHQSEFSGLKLGFNASYMLDVLQTINDAQVLLYVKDADSSMLLESADTEDTGRYIIMPMHL